MPSHQQRAFLHDLAGDDEEQAPEHQKKWWVTERKPLSRAQLLATVGLSEGSLEARAKKLKQKERKK